MQEHIKIHSFETNKQTRTHTHKDLHASDIFDTNHNYIFDNTTIARPAILFNLAELVCNATSARSLIYIRKNAEHNLVRFNYQNILRLEHFFQY